MRALRDIAEAASTRCQLEPTSDWSGRLRGWVDRCRLSYFGKHGRHHGSKYGSRTFISALAGASIGLGLIAACPFALAADESRETEAPVFSYPIAGVAGKSLTTLPVSSAPGAKIPAHRHGRAFVLGCVLEGAIRSQFGNGETKVYRVGESWSEDPGAYHTVSENASTTEPAKILAVFVARTDARDLVTIAGQAAAETKK